MTYWEIYEYATGKEKTLRSDKDFIGTSTIKHKDGTILILEFSCYEKIEDWLIFFTEHHKFFIYKKDDISWKFEKY